ncbi:hypothetical protein KKE26_00065 [bacterium]|nr:hypothetical protein [bacterium]MBU1752671.1 hypothetical protein [bacterium]
MVAATSFPRIAVAAGLAPANLSYSGALSKNAAICPCFNYSYLNSCNLVRNK